VSGSHGTILRTDNGGAAWAPAAPPRTEPPLDFRDIEAITEQTAYALSIGPG
jgi:photosystem II stability/assembly factor-like uncharacterized protein